LRRIQKGAQGRGNRERQTSADEKGEKDLRAREVLGFGKNVNSWQMKKKKWTAPSEKTEEKTLFTIVSLKKRSTSAL